MTGIFRSIASQNSCAFSTTITLDKVTGDFNFGFNNSSFFKFKSGLIYDTSDRVVYSYIQNRQILISGNIESGLMNYWIDGIPMSFQESAPFYISGFNYSWDNSKVSPNYFINILGDAPDYLVAVNSPVLTGQKISGYIQNLSDIPQLSMRIFSGDVTDLTSNFISLYTGNINGQSSGAFSISGYINQGIFNIPLQFFTNFGTVTNNILVTVTGQQ